MNEVGQLINVDKAKCRNFNVYELMMLLQSERSIFWSWGAEKFVADNVQTPTWFRMNVSGHHHKGHVYIFLNGFDLFDVYLTTKQGVITKRTNEMGIYNDQLVEWIDDNVERINEYRR